MKHFPRPTLGRKDPAPEEVPKSKPLITFNLPSLTWGPKPDIVDEATNVDKEGAKTTVYFDREGNPISRDKWNILFDEDRVIGKAEGDSYFVSTIFLGLEHGENDQGQPLIYETMVFPKNSYSEVDARWYATRAGAEAGHSELVGRWINNEAFD